MSIFYLFTFNFNRNNHNCKFLNIFDHIILVATVMLDRCQHNSLFYNGRDRSLNNEQQQSFGCDGEKLICFRKSTKSVL
jgi:hypothetical protein